MMKCNAELGPKLDKMFSGSLEYCKPTIRLDEIHVVFIAEALNRLFN